MGMYYGLIREERTLNEPNRSSRESERWVFVKLRSERVLGRRRTWRRKPKLRVSLKYVKKRYAVTWDAKNPNGARKLEFQDIIWTVRIQDIKIPSNGPYSLTWGPSILLKTINRALIPLLTAQFRAHSSHIRKLPSTTPQLVAE